MSVELPIKEFVAWLWKNTVRHVGYISFEDELEALKHDWDALKARRNDVQNKATTARRQNMQVLHEVEHWLTRVGSMEDDVDELISISSQELGNSCLGGRCPKDCCSRYSLGKKIFKKLRDVRVLNERGLFHYVATPVDEPFERTMRFVGMDNVGTIGLHGPTGVGKTTLLNQIGQNLLSLQPQFVHVMWVLVPHDLSLDKIQDDIGKEIGFEEKRWKGKSPGERAKDVDRVLRHDKYALLLDDLRDQVDLRSIGVPPPNENGSKVVFTTSSEEVCNKMGADEYITVDGLTWSKGWTLFQEKVGEDTMRSHPEIPKLAETVTRMCNGLPLAVVTIGCAMSGKKTPREWHHCIEVIQKSIAEFSSTTASEYFALLKFAFDSLPNTRVKQCFLYCALFPLDFSINRSKLIDCWIGEGFLDEPNDDHRGGRSEGYNIIKMLLDTCLLEEQGKEHVKIHEKIREVALWIACDCGKAQGRYLVETEAKLSEAPEVSRLEMAKRISLMKNHIWDLTTTAKCHDLLTLFLVYNDLRTISNTFFECLSSVRVLDLSENRSFTELPPGISQLSSLECIDLSSTGIRQLSTEMKKLVKLKCLNLEHTYALLTIPMSLLPSFLELKVLRMGHSAFSNQDEGYNFESFLRDLQGLKHLNLLTISIKSGFKLQLLEAYARFPTCTQALSLYSFWHTTILNISFLENMTLLDELDFNDCPVLEELSFEPQLLMRTSGSFNSLRKVSITNCSKLKHLTWVALAPNLESLVVSRCSTMEEIISQMKPSAASIGEFKKLEVLKLVSLPKLKSIHPNALPFPCMKEIVVDGCQHLKKLPLAPSDARAHRLVIHGWEGWWKNLEWEDRATKSTYSPCFKASIY